MQLVFSLSFVKLLRPFERITSYAHDQDHVHFHSHAILLHLEDSKYIHPPINKTPLCTMSISLQSYRYNVWAIQKEIKDAYPKKVCHMPTRHVKKKKERKDAYPKKVCHTPTRCVKKKEKKKIQPIPKILQGREKSYKGVSSTIHQKKISTHLHILIKAYDLFFLWIRSLTQRNMRSKFAIISSIPTDPPKRAIKSRMEKQRHIKRHW